MWFRLASADWSTTGNLGTMDSISNAWSINYALSGGISELSAPRLLTKGETLTATFTLAEGATITGTPSCTSGTISSPSVSGQTVTITVTGISNNCTVTIAATGGTVVPDDGTGDSTTYTITYKYQSGGVDIKTATTETVAAGTSKTFSTSNAPAIDGYTVSSVSPTSATINANTTVIYSYTKNASSGTETDISSLFTAAGLTAGAIYADPSHTSFGGTHSSQTAYYANGANTAYVNISEYAGKTLKITLPYATQASHVSYGIAFYTATSKSNAIADVVNTTLTYTDGSSGVEVKEITIPSTAKLARTTWLTPENETALGATFSAKIMG